MAITKVSKNMSIIASLSDLPNATDGLSPAQLKAKFDEGGESLKTYINDTLIPNLESIVDGNSGADNIGATPIGASPSTVQGILEWLKTQIDNTTLGQIPDGSITDAKLSDAEGNIKQTVNAHLADDAIHKTSQTIRTEATTPLRTEVVSSLPTSPQKGQLVFNEAEGKFTGYDGGKWL